MSELSLPSRQASYHEYFTQALAPILLVDPRDCRILELNPAAERFFGQAQQELQGKILLEKLEDEASTRSFTTLIAEILAAGGSRRADSRWKAALGQVKVMDVQACALKGSRGEPMIQLIATDVTTARNVEQMAANYLKELREVNRQLTDLSATDGMTGLFNFRHFRAELTKEHRRCQRYQKTYSLVFCDVDHFKKYNDAHGHPAGDEVLKKVAAILKDCARKTDLVARYGGEEFAIICPETDAEGAKVLAERIRSAVESHGFPHGDSQPLGKVTVSIGVSSYPISGDTDVRILEGADQALYVSKQNGRNQVTLFRSFRIPS